MWLSEAQRAAGIVIIGKVNDKARSRRVNQATDSFDGGACMVYSEVGR